MKKSYIRFFLIMAVLIAVGLMLSGREVRADDFDGENEEYSWHIYSNQYSLSGEYLDVGRKTAIIHLKKT